MGVPGSLLLGFVSLAATSIVVSFAYYQKTQFYPSVVYITKSNPSMAVIYFQSLVLVLMLGKLMRKIFLGTLRAAEFEHLMERFWYALTETCLAFTVFRDDFNPKFIALFTVLLFLKSFHWLAEDRVDYMERSPIIGLLFHFRVAGLLAVLGLLDYLLILYAYQSTLTKGATVQLVFGFEYAILITMVANTTIKYVLHAAELRSDTPWENKAVFLLYTELVIGLIRVLLYLVFVFLMVKIYTLPLFAFRPMYYTIRNFKKALNDVILSRRAIHNMNTLYPDATTEELTLSDNICIICREDMISSSKKLPCGHIFHTACLRSWFQRQQTCPTCRLNILRTPTTSQPQANVQPNINVQPNRPAGAANGEAPVNNQFMNLFAQTPLGQNAAPPSGSATAAGPPPVNMANGAMPPPFFFPTLPCFAPYAIPPPPMPPALDTLTVEELRALEGHERKNVEERLKLLRNIQTMLNASASLMTQYTMVVSSLPPLPTPIEPVVPLIPTPSTSACSAPSTSSESTSKTEKSENIVKIENVASSSTSAGNPVQVISSADDEVKIQDLGSEEFVDSKAASTSSFIARERDPETAEMREIRKRRLQKFQQNEN